MDRRIPKPIQPALQHYLTLMDQQLPDLLHAFYVEGSIALGGFNERFSDIDFIATLHYQMTAAEIDTVRRIHQTVTRNYPRWKLEGRYLPAHTFDQSSHRNEPHPHYHDGVLHLNGHFELNSVEGWILKNHGIALLGPTPQELSFTVEWAALIKAYAGEYALTCLPARWHPLIQEALRIRAGQKRSTYSFRPTRTIEAISFLKFIIQACNANFI
jgi:hypothetical protein